MKLLELFVALREKKAIGKFIGAELTPHTKKLILRWMDDNSVQNPVKTSDLHVTVILDKEQDFPWNCATYEPPLEAIQDSYRLEKFGKRESDGKENVLVLRFGCPELEERHREGRKKHNIKWDYPSYEPHITLSYDNEQEVKDLLLPRFPIFLSHEYENPFDGSYEPK